MGNITVLSEARRLWEKGFAILWLHPKSKRPIETGWTTGPRKEWNELERTYRPGYNLGTRLGTPSKIKGGFLAVVDVDIRSDDDGIRRQALKRAKALIGGRRCAVVRSGRGNGSRHYYYRTDRPFKASDIAEDSGPLIRTFMPSKNPSRIEREKLSEKEIKDGIRFAKAWAISLYSEGRQVVLPPSIHPDSLKPYEWGVPFLDISDIPLLDLSTESDETEEKNTSVLEDFELSPVEVEWLPISEKVRSGILSGEGVTDRSSFLLKASQALLSSGLSQNEVLTVLTDPKTFIGEIGYEHAQTKSRKRAAEWVYRYTLRKVSEDRTTPDKVFTIEGVRPRKLSVEEQVEVAKEFEEDRHWKQDLIRGKNDEILHKLRNVVLILENAIPEGTIRRDLFAYRDAYLENTPWGGKKGEMVSDDDVAKIKYWMGENFKFEPSSNAISDALVIIVNRHSFDPVKDFLDGLPAWDGVDRLDTWLSKYFEAKGDSEYLAQVFRKWMIAMVMRVYQPGAKFDWMPIFEGPQNIGKSSFGKILVGDRYFNDSLPPLSDKDSSLALQGMWGVEFGELTQFRKNELETIKSFVSRTVDKIRPPYGRRTIEYARRCVFFGTTNRETYLIDETGNRRFKPVVVGNLDFKQLRKDRVQLFAEAKRIYLEEVAKDKDEGFLSLDIKGKARDFEREMHSKKMMPDDSDSMLELMKLFIEKVEKEETKFDLQKFRIPDLFTGVGCFGNWKPDNRNFQFCSKMLKKLGAEKRKIRGFHYWKTPEKEVNHDFF